MVSTAESFGESSRVFLQQMAGQHAAEEPALLKRLREHFGCDPVTLPVLFAVDEHPDQPIAVEDRHLDEALRELVIEGGDLTKSLLGFRGQ